MNPPHGPNASDQAIVHSNGHRPQRTSRMEISTVLHPTESCSPKHSPNGMEWNGDLYGMDAPLTPGEPIMPVRSVKDLMRQIHLQVWTSPGDPLGPCFGDPLGRGIGVGISQLFGDPRVGRKRGPSGSCRMRSGKVDFASQCRARTLSTVLFGFQRQVHKGVDSQEEAKQRWCAPF